MAQAAYKKKVKVSTNGSTWVEIPTTGPSLDFGSGVEDATDTETNVGFRNRDLTLHDWSVSCDCNWKSGHAGLAMIRDAKLNRTSLHVQYLPVATVADGFQGQVVVESFNLSGDVGGLETVSITLQADGALAVAT